MQLDDLVLGDDDSRADDEEDDGLEFSLEDDLNSDTDVAFTDDELAALDSAEEPAGNAEDTRADSSLDDFDDLELDDLDVSLTDDRTGVDQPAPVDPPSAETDDELADLSLEEDDTDLSLDDLSLDDDTPSSPAEPASSADDLDELNAAEQHAAPAPEYHSEPQTAATPSAETSEVSDDMLGDDDDFDFLGETDENATKLDLARAYIDMGDAEGARDILNEVLSEGSDDQQGEAKELLARVS
jgi:pilus assembly protein FimV